MEAVARRIGEHIQTVILLLLISLLINLRIHRVLLPVLPPFLLNCFMIVNNPLRHKSSFLSHLCFPVVHPYLFI